MALDIKGAILPNTHVVKQNVVITGVVIAPTTDELGLHCGDLVALYRQLEIRNGWRYLWDQLRDRYILDPGKGFAGNIVVAGISINNMSEANLRITTDPIAVFNADDILISIGVNASALNSSLIMESGFAILRDAGGEHLKTL